MSATADLLGLDIESITLDAPERVTKSAKADDEPSAVESFGSNTLLEALAYAHTHGLRLNIAPEDFAWMLIVYVLKHKRCHSLPPNTFQLAAQCAPKLSQMHTFFRSQNNCTWKWAVKPFSPQTVSPDWYTYLCPVESITEIVSARRDTLTEDEKELLVNSAKQYGARVVVDKIKDGGAETTLQGDREIPTRGFEETLRQHVQGGRYFSLSFDHCNTRWGHVRPLVDLLAGPMDHMRDWTREVRALVEKITEGMAFDREAIYSVCRQSLKSRSSIFSVLLSGGVRSGVYLRELRAERLEDGWKTAGMCGFEREGDDVFLSWGGRWEEATIEM